MADEFPLGNGRWWDISRNRFESVTRPPASIALWPPMDSGTAAAVAGGSFVLHGGDQSSTCGSDSVLANQIVGLGLSTENMDWNQALLGGKVESSFCSMLEQDMSTSNTSNFQHVNDINRGFSLDQFSRQASSNDSSTITSQKLVTNFQGMNSSPDYHDNQTMINYPTIYNPSSGSYGANSLSRQLGSASHLNFTNNNTPFWNASEVPAAMPDARTSFFPADQAPAVSCFDRRPKNTSEVRDLVNTTTTKKNNTEQTPNKRPRNETPSSLPAFKVRKEKMGDRITALQQLVSPFGKTDTASVLSEAIEYIKFLHEQVNALSSPYMENGAPIQHQQNLDKYTHEITEGPHQDLKSRGLCLVPVSSTFPMTHETTVDFWTPTFGGTFR